VQARQEGDRPLLWRQGGPAEATVAPSRGGSTDGRRFVRHMEIVTERSLRQMGSAPPSPARIKEEPPSCLRVSRTRGPHPYFVSPMGRTAGSFTVY
jgi:hypothetical protein